MSSLPEPTSSDLSPGSKPVPSSRSKRISAIDWMRGLVMIFMVVDHASMAFDSHHLDKDSALYADAGSMFLPGSEFGLRWLTHLCAPTFVFLAGTALAISTERRAAKGMKAWEIDRDILVRGAFIALLDLTVISLGSGRWTLQVLLAIGLSMMCMAGLRRLSTGLLLGLCLGWFALGEWFTSLVWTPPGSSNPFAALAMASYGEREMIIKYPVLPWLAFMVLGWVFGRQMNEFSGGLSKISPMRILWVAGLVCTGLFVVVRGLNGYGNMFLPRADSSWQQWLHVSKYPPSLSYAALELGLMCFCLALLMVLERRFGTRENGVLLVFGQTAMFFYLVHRLVFEVPATHLGMRGIGGLTSVYVVSAITLLLLYPACRWFRGLKARHPDSLLRFI